MTAGTLPEVLAQAPFDHSFLLAGLSGGLFVVADGTPDDWVRLSSLITPERHMTSLEVRFRSSCMKAVPELARGYFFRPAVAACLSGNSKSYNLFVVGYCGEDGIVHTKSVIVPEMVVVNEDTREQSDKESVGTSLIINW